MIWCLGIQFVAICILVIDRWLMNQQLRNFVNYLHVKEHKGREELLRIGAGEYDIESP